MMDNTVKGVEIDQVREKLIELLYEAEEKCEYTDCGQCEHLGIDACGFRMIADHLIANGVTVQKWIPVTERLPEKEDWYFVFTTPNRGYKSINKVYFCKGCDWDNFTPRWHGAGGTWTNVTHWMPLPQAPKEG